MFAGVPRVWEKIEGSVRKKLDSIGGVRGWLNQWARNIGLVGGYAKQEGRGVPLGWWLANKALFERVKFALGLDQCRALFSFAAPVSKATLEFFLSVGIPIYELYGMSEGSGPVVITKAGEEMKGFFRK